jgi:ankyrin repeat protein
MSYDSPNYPLTRLSALLTEPETDWNAVIKAVKTNKHHAKNMDWKKRTPLHIACLKNPPIDALKAIVKAYSSALLLPDDDGMLPIHYVCTDFGSSEITLRQLIKSCPESAEVRDKIGWSPLHRCCSAKKSVEFFKVLILYCDDDSIILKDCVRRTALHLAVINNLGLEHLQTLIDAAPGAVEMEDVRGYSPIHYACSYPNVRVEELKQLLGLALKLSRVRTNNGSSCLDLLTTAYKEDLRRDERLKRTDANFCGENHAEFSKSVNQYWAKAMLIVHATARGRLLEESVNKLPSTCIHDMIKLDDCPTQLIMLALIRNPDWASGRDEISNLPLHIAAYNPISRRRTENYVEVVRLLINSFPEACKKQNENGDYPLTLAIRSGKKWNSGLKEIFNEFPGALDSLGLDARLLPFVFVKVKSVSKIFRIVTAFPNLIPNQ